jgi:hypothetical protein
VVCWLPEAEAGGRSLARLEDATWEVARRAACEGRPILPSRVRDHLQALSRYFVHSGETDDMEKVPVT